MLEYLYTMVYPSTVTLSRKANDLVFDAQMSAIADKYGLPDLNCKMREASVKLLPNHTEDAILAETAWAVYDLTPQTDRGLRDLLRDVLWNRRVTMFAQEEIELSGNVRSLGRTCCKGYFCSRCRWDWKRRSRVLQS